MIVYNLAGGWDCRYSICLIPYHLFCRFVLKKIGCMHPVAKIVWVGVCLSKLLTQSSHMPKQLDPDMFSAFQAVA